MEFIKSFIRKIVAIVKYAAELTLDVVAGPAVEIYKAKTVTHWNVVGLIARVLFFASFAVTLPAFIAGLAMWYMGWVIAINQVCFYIGLFGIVIANDEQLASNSFKFDFDFKKTAQEAVGGEAV